MGTHKPLYGFTSDETKNLSQRYHLHIKQDCTWQSKEEFISWVRDVGYIKGASLRKQDETKPHGPDNTYFSLAREKKPQKQPAPETTGCPCDGCTEPLKDCEFYGCAKWREWFVKNWNENIRFAKADTVARQCFQYEHPDMVREGIAFEPNQHIR